MQPGEEPGRPLDKEQTHEADHEVVGEAEEPGGDEVVGGAPGAGAGPGHVPGLEHQAAHQPRHRGHQVCDGQAEDQTRELAVTKPGITRLSTAGHLSAGTHLVLLNRMTGAALRLVTSARPRRMERASRF